MEYNKILVPLDGSKLAETVLPHVEKIAKGCAVPQVILLTVTEAVRIRTPKGELSEQFQAEQKGPIIYYGTTSVSGFTAVIPSPLMNLPVEIGKMAKTGYNYLTKIAEQLQKEGIQVSIAVLNGKVAEEITRFAKDENVDLIVMASRGKRGLRRWDVANAAPKVFANTDIPMLMVRPPAGFKETKPVRKGKAM
jgi:nucleotide-binding universal stress UspA family protein